MSRLKINAANSRDRALFPEGAYLFLFGPGSDTRVLAYGESVQSAFDAAGVWVWINAPHLLAPGPKAKFRRLVAAGATPAEAEELVGLRAKQIGFDGDWINNWECSFGGPLTPKQIADYAHARHEPGGRSWSLRSLGDLDRPSAKATEEIRVSEPTETAEEFSTHSTTTSDEGTRSQSLDEVGETPSWKSVVSRLVNFGFALALVYLPTDAELAGPEATFTVRAMLVLAFLWPGLSGSPRPAR